ncbi:MAG: hypothetical protein ACYTG0_01260 [Planctomycetota bacterium]
MTIVGGDQLVHNLDCDFPPNKDAIDWWTYLDMSEYNKSSRTPWVRHPHKIEIGRIRSGVRGADREDAQRGRRPGIPFFHADEFTQDVNVRLSNRRETNAMKARFHANVALFLTTTMAVFSPSVAVAADKPFFRVRDEEVPWLTSIVVAMEGSVLVFKDQRKKGVIEVTRSEDGGTTWGKPITVGDLVEIEGDTFDGGRYTQSHFGRSILGNAIVDETTGDAMVFTSSMKPAPILYRSTDHGRTWRQEKIAMEPDASGWLHDLSACGQRPDGALQPCLDHGRQQECERPHTAYR